MLTRFERKVYSQNGEDGVLEQLIKWISGDSKYFVEFGVQIGRECNTRHLREVLKFNGLMMDGMHENELIGLYKHFITAENINSLFDKYSVPYEFSVLSIDIDFNDLWVWKAIDKRYRPHIVVIEYNSTFPPPLSVTIPYNPYGTPNGTCYFGGSLQAINCVARQKGYKLIYCENNGVNAFFVSEDLLIKIPPEYVEEDICKIYKPGVYGASSYEINGVKILGHKLFNESMQKMIEYPSCKEIEILKNYKTVIRDENNHQI